MKYKVIDIKTKLIVKTFETIHAAAKWVRLMNTDECGRWNNYFKVANPDIQGFKRCL